MSQEAIFQRTLKIKIKLDHVTDKFKNNMVVAFIDQ